jgi:radical S-adenosyl methionine domain-containing protein 2
MKTVAKTKTIEGVIPSVNYHLWEPCNMRCKFCFATFQDTKIVLPKGHLPKEKSLELIELIAEAGFEKITFAGGEPTLCPWISELIKEAKGFGLTTMLVTNGTKLNEDFLSVNQEFLDWIILSVDSLNDDTNLKSGRAVTGKKTLVSDQYKEIVDDIKKFHYKLKINTVVHQLNFEESMFEFIEYAKPERWKVFQVLPIKGENDRFINELKISNIEFDHFLLRHKSLKEAGLLVSEENTEMIDSYVMIDPSGRFFTNKNGRMDYSNPILKAGIENAYQQMNYNYKKFINRGGLYNWNLI